MPRLAEQDGARRIGIAITVDHIDAAESARTSCVLCIKHRKGVKYDKC